MKKTMDVEQAVQWAVGELAKTPRKGSWIKSSWDMIATYAALGTTVDENRYGLVIDHSAEDGPHPDAVAIGDAIFALDACTLCVPEQWDPLSDLGDLGGLGPSALVKTLERIAARDRDGVLSFKTKASRLLIRQAVMRGAPDWTIDKPTVKVRTDDNGRPMWFTIARRWEGDERLGAWHEFETRCAAPHGRAPVGAYRKYYLDPDPAHGIENRADYVVWRSLLDMLADDLADLRDHEIKKSKRPERPWESRVRAPVVWREAV